MQRLNSSTSHASTFLKKKSVSKIIKPKIENEKIIKCKICQNPQTKSTLNFKCQHQLCGICIARLFIRQDFKSLSEKSTIKLECPICKSKQVEFIGTVETSLEELVKILEETYPLRKEKKKDICMVHNKLAENYCLECKKWICIDCKNLFHNNYFKDHNLVPEEPLELKKCKVHSDKLMDLFCRDCSREVCHFCSRKGENHEGHSIVTLNEYKNSIIKSKKKYKYSNFNDFDEFLKNCEKEFKKSFEDSFKTKQKIINEILSLIEEFQKEYFSKKQEREIFIENYFKIIRGCYYNYFYDLKIKDPIINTLNFINSVNKELLSINCDSEFTEDLEKIRDYIKLINPKKFFKYEIKFLHHSLNCIKTIKEEKGNHIYSIIQLKNGNIVTAGAKGVLNVWDLETLQKIDCFKAHEKNIYSVIQLSDGRLVSASGDLWIKFWDFENVTQPEPKIFDIIDQQKLKEKIEKMKKNKKIKNQSNNENDNDVIILRGPQKNNVNNINNKKIYTNDNNINTNNKQPNINNINQNSNSTFLNNQPNNVVNPNIQNINTVLNQNIGIDKNKGLSNPPDVSYSGGGVHTVLPQDISYGSSGQSNVVKNPQDIGYSGNGKENPILQNPLDQPYSASSNIKTPDVGYSGNGKENPLPQNSHDQPYSSSSNNKPPDVSYSGEGNAKILPSKDPDVAFGDSNINNNINNSNNNNNNTLNSIKEEEPQSKKIKDLKESDFDLPDESNENSNINKNKISKLKESISIQEDMKSEIPPSNPPKNPGSSEKNNSQDVAYSSNKGKIMINENGKETYIDSRGNRCLIALRGHYDDVFCLLETSKRQLVSCSKDGTILIWSIDNHSVIYNFKGHNNSVGCAIELSENKIITGGADCKIKIWDISSNPEEEDDILSGHTNAVFSICKINDKIIGSASCDKTIRLWDLEKRSCLCILAGHKGYVWSVVKLNEDNKIASASSDKTIKIWDIDELKCINTIAAHDQDITILSRLSDGKLASGSIDMKIKIWEC